MNDNEYLILALVLHCAHVSLRCEHAKDWTVKCKNQQNDQDVFGHMLRHVHVHSPCVWACWSDLSPSPAGPGRSRTGLSEPEPGWRRCVPAEVWRHRCGGSGSRPGSTALQTGAGRPQEASGAPGCTGPCIKAPPAPLVPRLRGERDSKGDRNRG